MVSAIRDLYQLSVATEDQDFFFERLRAVPSPMKYWVERFSPVVSISIVGLISGFAVIAVQIFFSIVGAFIQNNVISFVVFLVYIFAVSYIEASWFIAPVIATIERHGPISSLRRSWQLAGGFRWRIVGLGILLFVLFIVLSLFLIFVITIIAASNQAAGGIAAFIVFFAMVPIWLPLFFGTNQHLSSF